MKLPLYNVIIALLVSISMVMRIPEILTLSWLNKNLKLSALSTMAINTEERMEMKPIKIFMANPSLN